MSAKCSRLFLLSEQGEQSIGFRAQLDFQELPYDLRARSLHRPRDTNSALEQAKQYIEAHYTEALTVEQLAQSADFSAKYFVDLYKKKYGKSALEYAAELRIGQAKRLMAESGVKLRDIAHRVGYADEFYFSRKFKKMIGMPPAVYMKSRRREAGRLHARTAWTAAAAEYHSICGGTASEMDRILLPELPRRYSCPYQRLPQQSGLAGQY